MKRPTDAQFIHAACHGKLRFETYRAAQKAAKRSRHAHRGDRHDEPYHCRYCGGFHVGNGTKPKRYGKRPREVNDDRDY